MGKRKKGLYGHICVAQSKSVKTLKGFVLFRCLVLASSLHGPSYPLLQMDPGFLRATITLEIPLSSRNPTEKNFRACLACCLLWTLENRNREPASTQCDNIACILPPHVPRDSSENTSLLSSRLESLSVFPAQGTVGAPGHWSSGMGHVLAHVCSSQTNAHIRKLSIRPGFYLSWCDRIISCSVLHFCSQSHPDVCVHACTHTKQGGWSPPQCSEPQQPCSRKERESWEPVLRQITCAKALLASGAQRRQQKS